MKLDYVIQQLINEFGKPQLQDGQKYHYQMMLPEPIEDIKIGDDIELGEERLG